MDGARSTNGISLGVGKFLTDDGPHFMRWASDDGIARLPRNGSESASQSDLQVVANRVFYEFAPFWYMAQSWHCKKNNSEDSQNVFVLKGPLSSKEMYNLYTSRRTMKGSNLIIGVASKSVILKGTLVPATFFRTLAHIFELAKSGASYKAITAEDIKRGSAQSDFTLQTLPLWLLESSKQSLVGGQHLQEDTTATTSRDEEEGPADRPARSRSPDTAGSSQPNDQPSSRPSSSSGKITTFRDNLDETTISGRLRDADALFSSAPFWCYLYSHEKQQAKKTPPKTGKEMLHLYQQGCLPGWTPVIGLQDSVAMCNSIPPSLFLPLASLLDLGSLSSLIQVGPLTTYIPIGIKELSLWDKFRDVRGTKGQTARLGLSSSQQASNGQAAVAATAGMPRSLRRQYQSMGNIDPVVRSSSEISMAVPHVGSHLSVAAPNPFASVGAAAGVVGGSLPVSPYQQQYSPVAAMFYYVPTSPYSMHYPPTHYPYQPNGYAAWPATSPSPSPPIAQRHSEPYLPNFFQRTSGLVPTVEEAEVETNESERASSLAPPVSNTSIAPENPPSASGSGPEVGNSSMSSAGIRSILGSVEADGSDSSKWHSSSTEPSYGPSLDSVIPQPLSSSSEGKDQKQKEPRRGSRNSKWSTSLFQIILGEDHRDLCWWYYCKDDGDANEAVSGPWDSETMLIKVAAERSLERVYACSTRKSASPSSGSHPDKEAFSRITDLLAAANRE